MTLSSHSLVTPVLGLTALALFALNFQRYIDYRMQRTPAAEFEVQADEPLHFRWERHMPSMPLTPPGHLELRMAPLPPTWTERQRTFKFRRAPRSLEQERSLEQVLPLPELPPLQAADTGSEQAI
ncbi:MAG: hypothetical protein R2834_00485 [Rhodothermales bacterium]